MSIIIATFSLVALLLVQFLCYLCGWHATGHVLGMASCAGQIVLDLLDGAWYVLPIPVLGFVVFYCLYRRRPRRKRAPRAYGLKSRERIAALVRKVREAIKPRPVLRPVPQRG